MSRTKRDPSGFDYQVAELYENGERFADMERSLGVSRKMLRLSVLRTGMSLRPKEGNCGSRNGSWKNGKIVDRDGYTLVNSPRHPMSNSQGYVREHRLVMSKHIGRTLLPSEVVHHLNADRSDNRIENLCLYSCNAEHLAHELKDRCPKWTEDGLARIRAGINKSRLRSLLIREERDALL